MARRTSDGDRLLLVLGALANPHRLRIVAALAEESTYVSQLARDLGLSRPLLHMHLQRLQAAGLITDRMEISDDGKAMRWVAVTDFALQLDAASIAAAAPTLTDPPSADGRTKGKN
ncbi:MAG: winged helix-turn-helix transcriptional regulator [Nocardioidaceae bacterium]|nr:winged helix-turn-helix transcriptional regulator [Nocardioidaceae bacterium]